MGRDAVGRSTRRKWGWEQNFYLFRMTLTVFIAIGLAALIIFLVSNVPGKAVWLFFTGPFNSLRHLGNIMEQMIPLLFTGLAVSIMFSASQFNLGSEGAFFSGAVAATFAGVSLPFPGIFHPAAAVLFGGLAGAAFCGLPGYLNVKWGASEMVSSIIFNYIAFYLGLYVINYYLRDASAGAMVSYALPASVKLARILPGTRVHSGLLIAVFFVVLSWIFLYRTRWGYRIRVIGVNPAFARYAGIDTKHSILFSQLLGGFLAGVGGSVELLGMYRRFSWQILPGYGWSGVIVAILARRNPIYVPVAAFFLAYLSIGADIMSRQTDVANEFVFIVQGVIIVLVASEGFMEKLRHRIVFRRASKNLAVEGGAGTAGSEPRFGRH